MDKEILKALDEARPHLEKFLSIVGATEKTAKDILRAAESSDFDHVEIEKALHAHQADIKGPYGEFVKFRTVFEAAVKSAGVSPRKSPTPGGRRKPSNLSAMSADEIKQDALRLINMMPRAVKDAEAKGKEMSADMEITSEDPDTVEGLMSKLVTTRYFPFRDAVYAIFGIIGGLVKRVNARADLGGGVPIEKLKESSDGRRVANEIAKVSFQVHEGVKALQGVQYELGSCASDVNGIRAEVRMAKVPQTLVSDLQGAMKAMSAAKVAIGALMKDLRSVEDTLDGAMEEINTLETESTMESVDHGARLMSSLVESVVAAMGEERPMDDGQFVIEVNGSKVGRAKTYKEAVAIRNDRYPLGEVKAAKSGPAKKDLSKTLPWANDSEIIDF